MSVDPVSEELNFEASLAQEAALTEKLLDEVEASEQVITAKRAPVTRSHNTLSEQQISELFPNLTEEEKLQVMPLFSSESKSFLYEGTPAQQFAEHLDAMLLLTGKMRTHVEEQMERDKATLEKILDSKIDHHKACLEYEAKRDKWEWMKNVLDCLSLTITGFATLSTLYAYWNLGPAAPSAIYALESAFGAVCGLASIIMRAKKPEEVKMSMALSTMSLVISLHQWYANVAVYEYLLGTDPDLAKQIERFSKNLFEATGCLTSYKKATSDRDLMLARAKNMVSDQKFQKKGEAIGEGVSKHTIADKHFARFIAVASNALSQLSEVKRKVNRGA